MNDIARDLLTEQFRFHGQIISISGEPYLVAAVHPRLAQFPTTVTDSPDICFEFSSFPNSQTYKPEPPKGRGRLVYDAPVGEVLYFEGEDRLCIDVGDSLRIRCDLKQGRVQLTLLPSDERAVRLATNLFFTILLLELLKRRGLYGIHAAGLSLRGNCLVFPGAAGSGKSTLTLALLRAGFGFLADDLIFLTSGPGGLRARAFPEEVGVTAETARFFPELHSLLNRRKRPGWPKQEVSLKQVYGVDTVWESQPKALIFPRVANSDHSLLEPMEQGDALLELAPNVLLTEPRSSQAHFDILAQLVKETECYRLETGRDLEALPALLRHWIGERGIHPTDESRR